MSLSLNPLYHWAPRRLRRDILRDGLKIMMPSRPYSDPDSGQPVRVEFPWICLATTPSSAWGLILDPEAEHADADGAGWDLWQVQVREGDQLSIRGDFAPHVREVRVHNSISADRCWWVAERHGEPHETMPEVTP